MSSRDDRILVVVLGGLVFLILVAAAAVVITRMIMVDRRATGRDAATPTAVLIATCLGTPLVAAAVAALTVGGWWPWFVFSFAGFLLAALALGYEAPSPSAGTRRANRAARGEAVVWFLR